MTKRIAFGAMNNEKKGNTLIQLQKLLLDKTRLLYHIVYPTKQRSSLKFNTNHSPLKLIFQPSIIHNRDLSCHLSAFQKTQKAGF
jgi:hypothetical protein